MKVLQALLWASTGLAGLGLLGCHERNGGVVVYSQQQEPQYVVVQEAPPPIIVEREVRSPGPGYLWIEGYWHWNGHKYGWQRGHWARPPHERAVWVAPRYEKVEHGYRYAPGRWQDQGEQRREGGDQGHQQGGERQQDRH
jgi:hypothetical protein